MTNKHKKNKSQTKKALKKEKKIAKNEKKTEKAKDKKRKKPGSSQTRKKKSLNILKKKKNKALDTITSIYKQTEDLFKEEAAVEKKVKEEEKILAHIMNKRKKRKKRLIIISAFAFLLIIAAASVFGFIYFNKKRQFAEDKIKLEILGPDKATAGDEISYLINYKNEGEIELNDIALYVKLPSGFNVTEKVPQTENTTWHIDNLNINENGQIKIKGNLIDQPNTEQKIKAVISYIPENFSSEFSKTALFSTQLNPLRLNTEINHPNQAVPGQKFNISITYNNKTANDYDKLIFKLITPSEFEILQITPEAKNQEWLIENIKAESETEKILIEGLFNKNLNLDEVEKNQQFKLQISYPGKFDEKFIQKEKVFSISLSDQKVTTYLIINGKTENSSFFYGKEFNCSAIFANSGDEPLENLTANVIVEQEPVQVLNWEDSLLAGGEINEAEIGHKISWSIDNLANQEEKIIDFRIPIKKLTALENFSYDSLEEQLIKMHTSLNLPEKDMEIKGSTIEINLNSDLSLGVKALYYDPSGNEIGSGPLPPKTDKTTTYRIFWDISNNLHELTDLTVTTSLPPKVNWRGNEELSAGQITYNSDTDEIIWEINRLPQNINEAHANFELSLTPEKEDAGKLMKLTETTNVEAKDAHTNDIIILSTNPISTNLELDEKGKEKGVVELSTQE